MSYLCRRRYLLVLAVIVTSLVLIALGILIALSLVNVGLPAPAKPTAVTGRASPTPPATTATSPSTSTHTPVPTGTPTATSTPTATASPTPRVITMDVQSLGRLETARFLMQTVVDRTRVPTNVWDRVLGTDKLLLVAEGETVAGFDMAKVGQRDVSVNSDRITLILPQPEVLYSRIDNEKTYVYEHKIGLLRRPDKDIETEARHIAEQAMVEHALEGGILHQAEGNGRLLIAAFLRSLGFTDITIIVRTAY